MWHLKTKCVQLAGQGARKVKDVYEAYFTCFEFVIPAFVGRDSAVGIATRYGLDGPGIESLWGARFSAPWGPIVLLCNGKRFSFQFTKRPGRGVDHPPQPRAEVKERVELYLYSLSGNSWPVLG